MERSFVEALRTFPAKTFQHGETIIRQGDDVRRVPYLVSGIATQIENTQDGKEIFRGTRAGGDAASCLLGALSVYTPDCLHRSSFVARTDCVCHLVSIDDFLRLAELHPAILSDLLRIATGRCREVDKNFLGLRKGQAPARVAEYLMEHAQEDAQGRFRVVGLNISETARFLGMARTTVTKIVSALCRKGYLERSGKDIVVADLDGFLEIANGERPFGYAK